MLARAKANGFSPNDRDWETATPPLTLACEGIGTHLADGTPLPFGARWPAVGILIQMLCGASPPFGKEIFEMSKKRRGCHSPGQIVKKLRDADAMLNAGQDLAAVFQALDVSESTLGRWRRRYDGLNSPRWPNRVEIGLLAYSSDGLTMVSMM